MYSISITEVTIFKNNMILPVVAIARIVVNGCLVINGIKVLTGKYGLFISWPGAWKVDHGKKYYTVFPITKALQSYVSDEVLRRVKEDMPEYADRAPIHV